MKRFALAVPADPVLFLRESGLRRARTHPRVWTGAPALADVVAKVTIVTLFSMMAVRLAGDWLATGRFTGMLLLASEALVVALTLVRRPAAVVDRSWSARLLTGFATFGPSLVIPLAAGWRAPAMLTIAISSIGLTLVVAGKLSLGRSFGLTPANRGIVSSGMYRFVRHPIYFGYLVTHMGFILANPAGWNLLVLACADIALMLRARREEETLALDGAYRAYMDRVRWRVVPGLF